MYLVVILPLVAALLAQLAKMFLHSNRLKLDWKNLTAYSGMPSGHSSMVISLATIVGLTEGFFSPLFGVCLVLAVLIIRDALGIRRYLGQHGKMLNDLIKDLGNDDVLDHGYPHLIEKIGHTPAQIVIGGLIGFLTSLIGFWLFG